MTKTKPKVILLESNEDIREHARTILLAQGWDVTCEKVSLEALETLGRSKKDPFALFISNFKLPKMEGDDILERVKSISPMTQRMLVVSSDKHDILISAINKAKIHACILSPFDKEDLVRQAGICFKRFMQAKKRLRLKRITNHQNRQMLAIARKLKRKDTLYKKDIDKKKVRLLKLKSKNRQIKKQRSLGPEISLSTLLEQNNLKATPEILGNLFFSIGNTLKLFFDAVSTENKMEPVQGNLSLALTSETEDAAGSDDEIQLLLKAAFNRVSPQAPAEPPAESELPETGEQPLDKLFDLSVDESQTQAVIRKKQDYDPTSPPSMTDLLDWLSEKKISYGIVEDEAIESWLSQVSENQLTIARGEKAKLSKPGRITYHFQTDFTNPGKINEDGSIDFRERGDIPFVQAGTLLAQKTPAVEGSPGISVSGIPIPHNEVIDPAFVSGPGTELSEDELQIAAAVEGQPHLDAMGTVSVSPDLVISEDVDFKTGNIDFKGNIIVKGIVKEGFRVKGISLTANEIEGAVIDLSGDLHVSSGITDASIRTQGNVYAKFINNSRIESYGDISISKEIIDSELFSSGSVENPTGHIIASKIAAKKGVEAGHIGTSSSKPVHLKVGMEEHVNLVTSRIDEMIEESTRDSGALKDEIKKLEDKDQELYRQISEKAHIQDRSQLEIKELKDQLEELEKSQDQIRLAQALDRIKLLVKESKKAEKELNDIFEIQDDLARQIEEAKQSRDSSEEKTKELVLQKTTLKEFSKKEPPQPVVSVLKTAGQDTVIKGPHSSLILTEDKNRCTIKETPLQEDNAISYVMTISDL